LVWDIGFPDVKWFVLSIHMLFAGKNEDTQVFKSRKGWVSRIFRILAGDHVVVAGNS